MTLLVLDTYQKISSLLKPMWISYQRAGVDILGVERTNAPTEWPEKIPCIPVGEDVFKRWCEHRSPTLLNRRWLDIMKAVTTDARWEPYDNFCFAEWNVYFARPLPEFQPPLMMLRAGGSLPGFKSKTFYHTPWWIDRKTIGLMVEQGESLMAKGENEQGSTDFFIGLILQELGIKPNPFPGMAFNALDNHLQVQLARKAIDKGAACIHGVKTEAQLKALTQ